MTTENQDRQLPPEPGPLVHWGFVPLAIVIVAGMIVFKSATTYLGHRIWNR